jgi:hypothetical protein
VRKDERGRDGALKDACCHLRRRQEINIGADDYGGVARRGCRSGIGAMVRRLLYHGLVRRSGTTQRGIGQERTCQHHVRLLLLVDLQIRMKRGCAGGKKVPLNWDTAAGQVVQFGALDVETVLSGPEGAMEWSP